MKKIERRLGYRPIGESSISWGAYTLQAYEDWATATMRQGQPTQTAIKYEEDAYEELFRQDRYLYYSIWVFPTLTNVANATGAKLTITRDTSEGSTGDVTIEVYKHALTAVPSGHDYTVLTDTGLTASLGRNESATIDLDATTLTALKAGTIKGFGIYAVGSYAQMTTTATIELVY
jgi:hypothetical protein